MGELMESHVVEIVYSPERVEFGHGDEISAWHAMRFAVALTYICSS
jgi:hypothetical protein